MYSSKRNFSYYMINNVILGIIPFISLSIFSRILTPQDYGLYALYLIVGTAFSSITNFGLPVAHEILYFEQKDYKQKVELTFSSIVVIIILSLIAFIPVYLFEDLILRTIVSKNYSTNLLYLSCFSSVIFSLNFYFYNHFRNDKNGKSYTKFRALSSILTLLISIYLIIIYKLSFEAFFISTALTSLLFLFFFILKFKIRLTHVNPSIIIKSIKIALPLIPKILFGLLRSNYDRLLINNVASQSVVGIYDLGLKASNLGTIFFQSLYNTYIPGFYDQLNKKEPGYRTAVPNFIMKSFAIYILALLSFAFFSFEIFNVTTPKSFHAAINMSSIISVTLAFNFIEAVPLLLFLKKTNLVTLLYISISTIILISGVLFGLNYGIYGFLISNLILSIISTFIYFMVYQKNLRLNWPWKKILSIYFYLLISAALIIFLRINETEYLIRLIIKLFLLIGSVSIILKFKIFIIDDFKFISNRIKLY